jgi:hypothetical protein
MVNEHRRPIWQNIANGLLAKLAMRDCTELIQFKLTTRRPFGENSVLCKAEPNSPTTTDALANSRICF